MRIVKPKIALVHDDLVQFGGAERVLAAISDIFPDAPIFTSLFDKNNPMFKKAFSGRRIITSFLQEVPGWRRLYKLFLPFYGLAFEQFDFNDFDLVISHTTRFAKAVVTKPMTKHVCYCHTPPRFLWHFSNIGNYGLGDLLLSNLRVYDQVSARRVDHFLSGSVNAQKRIRKVYGVESEVIYPFVDLNRFKSVESFDGGYFLIIGRPNKYKRFDLAVNACKKIGIPLRIISGNLSDELVVQIISGCRALIIPGIEDFGLISLEAQALGKPVVAFKEGGVLETVIPNKTGIFFSEASEDSLKDALMRLESIKINPNDCIENAEKFSKEKFNQNFKQTINALL